MYFYFLALAAASLASAKVCTNVTVPVNIDARQGVFDVPTLQSNLDAVQFALNFTSIRGNFTNDVLTGYQTVQFPANISAKFCKPDNDKSTNPTVQVLIHGIGFDKSYWDLPYNGYNYSYEDVAVDKYGFCTVAIDRYGIGNSSHGEPLNMVQAPAEVSALYEITQMLRNGTFPTVAHSFKRVLHVGHSFGSAQTYTMKLLTAMYPGASDGISLTGYSMNGTWLGQTLADWNLHLARLNQPLRFGSQRVQRNRFFKGFMNASPVQLIESALRYVGIEISSYAIWEDIATTEVGDIINQWNASVAPIAQDLPTGYLTWTDLTSNIFAFLYPPYFDIGAGLFAEATKQPVTLGEVFTLAGAPATNSFPGPVQVLTGRQDTIYCGGDCLSTGGAAASIPAGVAMAFPNASDFEAYIHPNTGHGINFHYNATGAYNVIQEWFVAHGFASS